jgi:hypothetical protein
MQELPTFFCYCLTPKSFRSYIVTSLWRYCLLEEREQSQSEEPTAESLFERPQPPLSGWEQVLEYINPVFTICLDYSVILLVPQNHVLDVLSYAYQLLKRGDSVEQIITKLDRIGSTFLDAWGNLNPN